MKPLADGNLLKSNTVTAAECLNYALSLPTSVVITGCETMERLNQAISVVRAFRPMSETAINALLRKTQKTAATGEFEPFKTTSTFDGTASNPQWMG